MMIPIQKIVIVLLLTVLSTNYANARGVRHGLNCLSWRLAVETNNYRKWSVVPLYCEKYVRHYMLGKQYRKDLDVVADAAIKYANSLTLAGDGKDVWVFDIDETILSNLPYYSRPDIKFGGVVYNSTKFDKWVSEGRSLRIPAVSRVYRALQSLGIKTVLLTGASEKFRSTKVLNLNNAGYHKWEKLILRGEGEHGLSAVVFKSNKRTELVSEGYRILGNIGDQWSDLLGSNPGNRTFKLPNPMYYIA